MSAFGSWGASPAWVLSLALAAGCATTLPDPKMPRYAFPKDKAFVGDVKRPYVKLGQVRTKINFNTLDWVHEENQLCRNFYNKAARDLVERAKDAGGDAVIDVRSVVFNDIDGAQSFQTPECSDDGQEGQILLEGIAVKWKPTKPASTPPISQKD